MTETYLTLSKTHYFKLATKSNKLDVAYFECAIAQC